MRDIGPEQKHMQGQGQGQEQREPAQSPISAPSGRTGATGRLSGFAIGLGAGSVLYHFAPQTDPWPTWVVVAAAAAAIVSGTLTIAWERRRSAVTVALGASGALAGVAGLLLALAV